MRIDLEYCTLDGVGYPHPCQMFVKSSEDGF